MTGHFLAYTVTSLLTGLFSSISPLSSSKYKNLKMNKHTFLIVFPLFHKGLKHFQRIGNYTRGKKRAGEIGGLDNLDKQNGQLRLIRGAVGLG